MTEPAIHYQGRKWDAPLTDDAAEVNLAGLTCTMCEEPITADDNAILITWANQPMHLECYLRPVFGGIAHLEGRCSCPGGPGEQDDPELTAREDARATLDWIIAHRRGRFHP